LIGGAYAVSLRAASGHSHALVEAGLLGQERIGRISRSSLDA